MVVPAWRFLTRRLPAVFAVLLGLVATAQERPVKDPTATQRILQDIKYLASDELEGRGVGTRGIDRAADYVREQFQSAGLKPTLPDGGYFQSFETPNGSELAEPNRLAVQASNGDGMTLKLQKDFAPLAISGEGVINAPLAFAGYGISAPKVNYDDFAGFDVAGKAVIIMSRGPRQSADPHAPADPHAAIGSRQMDLKQKISNAASHGAVAVLFVNGPQTGEGDADKLMEFGEQADFRVAKIPAVQITRATADALIQPALGKNLREMQSAIDSDMKPRSGNLEGRRCTGEITVRQKLAPVKNVLGVLEGTGPHANETIVVGAHYDHLGYGEVGSMAPGAREIHNGADDNASGTTGLIELARRLSRRGALPRRVLFAAFTAEERGLIGSDYYVKNPAVPLEQTVTMINLDMIGRLRNDKLIVEGVGTAQEFRPLVESLNRPFGFNLKPVASGLGPSDQTSFCLRKIPVLFYWTDYHPDYHKPSDDWDKISLDGIDRVVSLVEESVIALAAMEKRPAFVEVPMPASPAGDSGGERAYLGTIPAFGEEVDGVMLSGVTTGAPADLAGIRGADVIVRIGELAVHNLQDMQTALETHRPGDRIKITVRRADILITYPVTLGRRK
jgi:Peptidase family M28/PA domain/PDZ domain